MMKSRRVHIRQAILFSLFCLSITFLTASRAQQIETKVAQPLGTLVTPPNAPKEGEFTDAISLPTDRQIRQRLEAAEGDYIKSESWAEASKLLQSVLMSNEDVFV